MIAIRSDTGVWIRKLQRASKEALPRAQAAAINAIARVAHAASGRTLRRVLILRNQYTERSLRISEARVSGRTGRVGYAKAGTISQYLPLQETGGQRRPVRGRKVPVPTLAARGGNWRRPILRRFTVGRSVELGRGSKFFVLRTRRGSAIFTRPSKRRLLKVRILGARSYHLKATHWHTAAVRKYATRSLLAQVFVREAKRQLGLIK